MKYEHFFALTGLTFLRIEVILKDNLFCLVALSLSLSAQLFQFSFDFLNKIHLNKINFKK